MLQVLTFMPCPHWVLCPLKVALLVGWGFASKRQRRSILGEVFYAQKSHKMAAFTTCWREPHCIDTIAKIFRFFFCTKQNCVKVFFEGPLLLVSWASLFNFLGLKLPFVPHYVSKVVQATIKELHGQFVWKMGSFFISLAKRREERNSDTHCNFFQQNSLH